MDHFVIATCELDDTVDALHDVTGVCPVEGGPHIERGTRNYLLGLGERCYLEIIAIDERQPEPVVPRLFALDRDFGPSRLVTWAIAPCEFDEVLACATAAGANLGSVSHLRRPAVDGEIRLRLTERPDVLEDGVVPFLVDWGTTSHPAPHLPSVELVSFRLTHPHPARIGAVLDAMKVQPELGWGVTPGIELVVKGVHGPISIR